MQMPPDLVSPRRAEPTTRRHVVGAGLALAAAGSIGGLRAAWAAAPVVVYTSVDQEYTELVLKDAAQATGLAIKPVFDAEAAKTVGLERRLVAERARPRADVFWNSEYLRTWSLAREGVLAPRPASVGGGNDLPAAYMAPQFAGMGLRARIIAYNPGQVAAGEVPRRVQDLIAPRWKGRVALAKPLFGTASTHFAALYAKWGEARFVEFLKALKANEVRLLPGNGDVRDAVVEGRVAIGLTDTDDAVGALRRKQPLAMVFPDQDTEGAFAVFQTVAMVRNGPNPQGAASLAAYLAGAQVEQRLISLGAVQIPARPSLKTAPELAGLRPKVWHASGPELLTSLVASTRLIQQHLL